MWTTCLNFCFVLLSLLLIILPLALFHIQGFHMAIGAFLHVAQHWEHYACCVVVISLQIHLGQLEETFLF